MNLQIPPPPPLSDDSDNNAVTAVARSAAEQDSDIPLGWKPTMGSPLPVKRCSAIKKDGTQCRKWSVRGTVPPMCTKHGASLPSVRKAAAERVAQARVMMQDETVTAFNVLQEMMKPGVPEGIRLKAATEILDRAGLKAGQEIAVTVEHVGSPLDDIMSALESIATNKPEEIIQDAEIVEED